MRNWFVFIVLISGAVSSEAQQKPQFTQYIQNQYIINPALTGIENYIDVKMSHRHQWEGLTDAPVTTYFTAQGRLGKKDYRTTATSFKTPGYNPRGHSYWEQYESAKPHHGLGVQIVNDRTGPLNRFEGYLTYAYHIGISPKTSLAAGFGAGIYQISLDRNKVNTGNFNVDPALDNATGIFNQFKPDLNAGFYLYSADYFIGLSALQLIPQQALLNKTTLNLSDSNFIPHLFLTGGYRLLLNDDFNFLPSVMVKYSGPLQLWQYEFNAKFLYQDLAWIGASYRHQFGFAAMMGVNISSKLNIGYSYDYTTSRLNTFARGTHEVIVGFLLGNSYGDTCPKNVW